MKSLLFYIFGIRFSYFLGYQGWEGYLAYPELPTTKTEVDLLYFT